MENKDSIIKKIQKALRLAGGANDDEGQTALLLAQRMMAKYNLSKADINISIDNEKNAIEGDGTAYTRLQWWTKNLANIIANNFKCYCFTRSGNGKSKIVFMGLEEDVEICKIVFTFAVDSIKYNSDLYVTRKGLRGDKANTMAVKNDYIAGYLQGLKDLFAQQVEKEELSLVLIKDEIVVKKYEAMNLTRGRASRVSMSGNSEARSKGYNDGKRFSHNRKAIGE